MMRDYDLEFLEHEAFMPEWERSLAYQSGAGYLHNGHRRKYPTPLPFMPPLPEDEADLFDAGEAGHEKIEDDALKDLMPNETRRKAIYFGNWQRDLSQVIVPSYFVYLGGDSTFLSSLIFEVVDVMAEAKFGHRLNRQRFGTYRWEEHIDNPRDYGIALSPSNYLPIPANQRRVEDQPERPFPKEPLSPKSFKEPFTKLRGVELWREGPGGIARYISSSQNYVLTQLGLAMRYGPDDSEGRGLEHFGNAMHTVEDFYAHSNFIEIGLNTLNLSVKPATAMTVLTGHREGSDQPLRDRFGRLRLITGVFLMKDTLFSLEKLLLKHIEGRPPGSPPTNVGHKVIRVLVRRLLGEEVLKFYDNLMRAWQATGIPAFVQDVINATGLPDIIRLIEEQIIYPLRKIVAALLRPLVNATAQWTGNEAFPTPVGNQIVQVVEPSHSRLSKDDTHHHCHGIARQLAIQAVKEFYAEMERIWSQSQQRQISNPVSTSFPQLVNRYMNHPQAVGDWWIPILKGAQQGCAIKPVSSLTPVPTRAVRRPARLRPASPQVRRGRAVPRAAQGSR